jgi:hypothetical protein
VGVGAHIGSPGYGNVNAQLATVGASIVRFDVRWDSVEHSRGVYSFPAKITEAFANARANGQSVLPIIDYGNPLYDGGRIPRSTAGVAAYAKYVAAIVRTFHPQAIEIQNEFNNDKLNKSGCVTADCYLPLLKAGYAAAKAVDPNVTVVGGAIAKEDDAWIGRLLQIGGADYMDALSFHPYNNNSAPEYLADALTRTQAMIQQKSGRAIPIWITELGWDDHDVNLQGQVDYLVRSMAILLGSGVQKYIWYDLVNDQISPTAWVGEASFGLFTQAGAPKPAAYGMLELTRQLGNRPAAGREAVGGSVYSYKFGSGADGMRIAWAATPTTATVHATGPVTVTNDLTGHKILTPTNGVLTLQLTSSPIYLEGEVQSIGLG